MSVTAILPRACCNELKCNQFNSEQVTGASLLRPRWKSRCRSNPNSQFTIQMQPSHVLVACAGDRRFSPLVEEPLQKFWEVLSWVADTILFVYIGVVVAMEVVDYPTVRRLGLGLGLGVHRLGRLPDGEALGLVLGLGLGVHRRGGGPCGGGRLLNGAAPGLRPSCCTPTLN